MSKSSHPKLKTDMQTDVAIVGGGITGLSTAYLLLKAGLSVVVMEKHTLAGGTTGGTTGKVTSQHGLRYADLSKRLSEDTARLYGEANQAALERIEHIIETEKIDCDWSRADNYIYTTKPENVSQFKEEANAAAKLGLPASFETKLDLPFNVAGAVKFGGQAKFQAKEYVKGLAKSVTVNGGFVFENTKAIGFKDGNPAVVKTQHATVTAKHVIVATKVPAAPLLARLSYCFYEFPTNSYIIAAKMPSSLSGMYISPDKGSYSILPLSGMLLIGGENHLPINTNYRKHYQKLADFGVKHFGIERVDHMWRAMDYLAYDGIPLIGKLYPWSKNIYTATAFQKWGLSTSMVAATILRDLILGKPNPWARIFRTNRFSSVASIPRAVKLLQ